MSAPQPGSTWTRAELPARFLVAVSTIALLSFSCSTVPHAPHSTLHMGLQPPRPLLLSTPPGMDRDNIGEAISLQPERFQPRNTWGGQLTGARSHFNQSCGAACAAPVNPSTGEILAPAASRASPALKKIVQAAQGLLTFERALTGAELDQLEGILMQCVAQAHADLNEAYQQQDGGSRFKNGKFPSDTECDRTVRISEKGQPITLAQELGRLKHAAAFACIKTRLSKDFGDNFSIEPRYKGDPDLHGVVLTNGGPGSLVPDLVVHATRSATQVQCVYELKFPCHERFRLNPLSSPSVVDQLRAYQNLTKRCPAALVTPSGLRQLDVD